jgi:hypothetical protein
MLVVTFFVWVGVQCCKPEESDVELTGHAHVSGRDRHAAVRSARIGGGGGGGGGDGTGRTISNSGGDDPSRRIHVASPGDQHSGRGVTIPVAAEVMVRNPASGGRRGSHNFDGDAVYNRGYAQGGGSQQGGGGRHAGAGVQMVVKGGGVRRGSTSFNSAGSSEGGGGGMRRDTSSELSGDEDEHQFFCDDCAKAVEAHAQFCGHCGSRRMHQGNSTPSTMRVHV